VIKEVSLLQQFKWKSVNFIAPGDETLLKMPSLSMRPFEFKPVVVNRRDNRVDIRFGVKLTESESQNYKLGEAVFYGYPIEHSGRVEAILTKKDFHAISSSMNLKKYQRIIQNNSFDSVE
jgi:hypothetical protein